jgi:alcohol dehydrogenase class IV
MTFVFNAPPTIIAGAGSLDRIGELVASRLGLSVLLVTDKGLSGGSIITSAVANMRAAGIAVTIFDDVVADPPSAVVEAAAQTAVAAGATVVVGLGGGSSMDVAKLAALLAPGKQTLASAFGVENAKGPRLPLMLVPTTAGTGSEVTPIAIVTTGEHEKMGVSSHVIIPDIALLDPLATVALPPHITAATGLDAMVHAIEAYTSISPLNNPISRMLAEKALGLLAANLERAVTGGSDLQARSDMLLGAMLAGQAFANSPVAAVHALAYPIGSLFGVPHGVSNALVLLPVMRFNRQACEEGYAALAPFAFPALAALGTEARVDGLIAGIEDLMRKTSIPSRLADVGIDKTAVSVLAEAAMNQTRLLQNNPRPVSLIVAKALYAEALRKINSATSSYRFILSRAASSRRCISRSWHVEACLGLPRAAAYRVEKQRGGASSRSRLQFRSKRNKHIKILLYDGWL